MYLPSNQIKELTNSASPARYNWRVQLPVPDFTIIDKISNFPVGQQLTQIDKTDKKQRTKNKESTLFFQLHYCSKKWEIAYKNTAARCFEQRSIYKMMFDAYFPWKPNDG